MATAGKTKTPAPAPRMPRPNGGLLRRHEAAEYMQVSEEFVLQLVRKKLLREVDIAPSVKRYRVADLDAYIASRVRGRK